MAKRRKRRSALFGEVTKRDFQALAAIFCEYSVPAAAVAKVSGYFKTQNPRFDEERFKRATQTCKR